MYSDSPHVLIVLCSVPTGKKVVWDPKGAWRLGQRGRLSAKNTTMKTHRNNFPETFE
jgi:hypothetical protein